MGGTGISPPSTDLLKTGAFLNERNAPAALRCGFLRKAQRGQALGRLLHFVPSGRLPKVV
jgi:hypothetical protein